MSNLRILSPIFSLVITLLLLTLSSGCSESNNTEKDTRSADSHLLNSEKYIKQGQYRAAMLEVRNAIKKAPNAKTIGALAEIYNELGQSRAAQSLLEDSVETHPKLNLLLAETYLSLGKFYSAEQALQKITAPHNNTTKLQLLEAKIHIGRGRITEGLVQLEAIQTQYPDDSSVQLAYFIAIFNSATPQETEEALVKLTSKFPEDADILYTEAKIRFLQNNYEATEDSLMKALHLSPQTDVLTPLRSGILNLLSKTLTQQGRYADAVPFQKLLKEANPDLEDVQARLENAIATIQKGDIKAGEELLEKLHQDFPNIETTEALLGLVNLELGDANKAASLFQGSVDPETAAPRLSAAAAMAELKLDRQQEALSILEQALASNPNSLQLHSLYGLTALNQPSLQRKAAQSLEKAITLGTPDLRIYQFLANYYYTVEQDKQKSVGILNKASKTFSNSDEKLKIFGNYLRYGFNEEATRYANNLKVSDKNSEAGWLMTAAMDIKNGRPNRASVQLEKAIDINPNSEKTWFLIGSNEMQLQNWNKAIHAFKQAINLNIDSSDYLIALLKAEIGNNSNWSTITRSFSALAKDEAHRVKLDGFLADYAIRTEQFSHAESLINNIKNSAASTTEQITFLEVHKITTESNYHLKSQNQNAAIQLLESGRIQHPESIPIAINLGNLYLQQGSISKAEKIQDEIGRMNDPTIFLLFTADILIKKSLPEEAYSELESGWQANKDPRLANAVFQLSTKLKTKLSDVFFKEWASVDTKNFRPVLIQAMNAQTNNSDDAIALYEKTLQLNDRSIPALNNLAWLYQEKNKLERADTLATRAVELAPESAAILDTAGYIKYRLGDKGSITLLEKAFALAPGEKEIEEHLNKAKASFN